MANAHSTLQTNLSDNCVDYLIRAGDGENFKNSSRHKIWGIESRSNKYFMKNVKPGDRLWFVKSKSQGKLLAVATYKSHNFREFGPLVDISMTDEQLGWTGGGERWTSNVEIHYTDLYGLEKCDLLTNIQGPLTIRKYNDKCKVNLPLQYSNIVRFSNITFEL